jgi:putative oxidoreductase
MMKSEQTQRILKALEILSRIVLAGVFILAAVPKILHPDDFAKAVMNYKVSMPIIGQSYVFLVAGFLPSLEAIAAVAVLWNRTKRAAGILLIGMLLLFIVLIAQAMIRGFNIDCGCFGSGAGATLAMKVGWEKIIQNVCLTAMAVFVLRHQKR